MTDPSLSPFAHFGLAAPVLQAVEEVGYETPSPIQAEAIPPLLEGHDLLGQAQTGTGKTAAFALPLLSRLDLSLAAPQMLVLTPTRELAIQVAEALQTYARHLRGFHVLPIYGGQSIGVQLRQLKRGAHVIVGTPGRIIDHLGRKTLKLDQLKAMVLDEADEMLRMGFIDDVEAILEATPPTRQVALFSATMPPTIARVANKHLKDPVEIRIASKTATVSTVEQRFWPVSGLHKLDALTRILEVEEFDGMLVFVRTKLATEELAGKLEARGYAATALNGDMPQPQRERTIEHLRSGKLDIVVATDVAARGLDVERITHVINYDIPYDPEAYVHRIGRTGRAGRTGQAILFVAPRERRMLRIIEQATRQQITPMRMPTREDVTDRRVARFKELLDETLESQELDFFQK
ncbi:MAG: ATP-dependent helicase, partial [Gammaproteobacteria bacterium]